MLRIAALAAVLFPALAHADAPGMTPSVESGAAPTDPATSNLPPTTDPAVSNLPPATVPAPSVSPPTTNAPLTYAPPSSFPPSYPPAMGPGPELPLPPPEAVTPSYRRLTLGFDLATVGLFALALEKDDGGIAMLSLGTYVLGTPLVHVAMRRPGRALASVSMRLALPIVGGFMGQAMRSKCVDTPPYYDDCDTEGPSGEAVIGALLGITAAMVIDSAFLAGGDPPKARPVPAWEPTLHASQNGFSVGAAGSF